MRVGEYRGQRKEIGRLLERMEYSKFRGKVREILVGATALPLFCTG